jgi:hypothetical protein
MLFWDFFCFAVCYPSLDVLYASITFIKKREECLHFARRLYKLRVRLFQRAAVQVRPYLTQLYLLIMFLILL